MCVCVCVCVCVSVCVCKCVGSEEGVEWRDACNVYMCVCDEFIS